MHLVTSQTTVTSGSEIIVGFDTIDFDPSSSLTTGSAAKFTAPITGVYTASANVNLGWTGAAASYMVFYKNGSAYRRSTQLPSATTATVGLSGTITVQLNSGDTFQIAGFQNSGANGTFAGQAAALTWFSICYSGSS